MRIVTELHNNPNIGTNRDFANYVGLETDTIEDLTNIAIRSMNRKQEAGMDYSMAIGTTLAEFICIVIEVYRQYVAGQGAK
jgi:hypothetical protein